MPDNNTTTRGELGSLLSICKEHLTSSNFGGVKIMVITLASPGTTVKFVSLILNFSG